MNSSELENLAEYYHQGKLSHAYLIETNNIPKCLEVLLKVVKNIFCIQNYEDNCNKCSLCHLIDLHNLPSLKIIEPDGNFIKKDQIIELRDTFSKSSQYTKENIYIIMHAEKMNKESANTILKFLEEPDGNVIGFFITKNKDNIMPTIQSRCQHLEVNFKTSIYEMLNIDKLEYEELLEIVKEYLYKLEIENKELILYNKKYFNDYDKIQITNIFKIILEIYKDKLEKQNKFVEIEFINDLTIKNVLEKINLVIKFLSEISYNVNVDLLLDKFVIEFEAINNADI